MANVRPQLARPALVLVTDRRRVAGRPHSGREGLDDVVREAVQGGVNVVQLREKDLGTAALIELGLHVRDAIAGRALFFVNGDLEAARALRADGIHVPSYGPTVRDVRAELSDAFLISLAVHSKERAIAAADEGADMIQLGAVFETATHSGVQPLGLAALHEICAAVTVPVVAIGGITAENAASVMAAGVAGVAVIGAIHDATDARSAATALRTAISG